nr:hypothetical protein Csa_5G537530 [Ipomoea batatas]GMC55793.1 hypothetical protein Csa_5G537530 [Ipomoea batatas]GMC55795.1 hypothetical protein Csa_5G537530 [Ipomoea batatas]GME19627.1 hypothetical protein Csa_5G537530 [Ipomoea batatas]
MVALLLIIRFSLREGVSGKLQLNHRSSSELFRDTTTMHIWMQRNRMLLIYSWGTFSLKKETLTFGSWTLTSITMSVGMESQMLMNMKGLSSKDHSQMGIFFMKANRPYLPGPLKRIFLTLTFLINHKEANCPLNQHRKFQPVEVV